ncbi:hypothetical protein [Sinorhizobium meliloti]|uniref:hypothetical protein n=1 Tax=Rhizobium meliloti TaxID=382 RepID=UPI000FDC86DE|nr:hypothetical protein [Sinorhizobium meliloti]RVN37944.1 hypothetical protein CN118_14315 [Sinorhizobium meliloti]
MTSDADNFKASSRHFLEDTLSQCLRKVAEQRSALDEFVRGKEAEIEKFRQEALSEIHATEAVIKAVEKQLGRAPAHLQQSEHNREQSETAPRGSSHSRRIVELTKQILAEEGRPLNRHSILERLLAGNLDVASNDLPGLVTKALSRSGEFRVEKRHYWLADRPIP